jgi:DNA-binding protein H-NS
MSNLVDIQNQIEKLQRQASEIKTREFDKTVQEIREKMQAFGITIKDLQAASSKPRKGKAKAATAARGKKAGARSSQAGTVVAAKYRGPNGETWSGRGLTPKWLAALLEQGKTKDDFLITT